MRCPVCKKEFDEYTGRRPKKFCSDACKVKYFNAVKTAYKNNAATSTIVIKTKAETPQFKNDIERQLWEIQQEQKTKK